MPEPQQCRIWAASATYTTAHSNAGSPTHWVRPGIEPATSWFLVRFINHWAMMGTPPILYFFFIKKWVTIQWIHEWQKNEISLRSWAAESRFKRILPSLERTFCSFRDQCELWYVSCTWVNLGYLIDCKLRMSLQFGRASKKLKWLDLIINSWRGRSDFPPYSSKPLSAHLEVLGTPF